MPLSLKCVATGRARYRVAGRECAVDDGGWLIVNDGQPYSIEIAAPTPVETFIVWFPRGWAEEVLYGAVTPAARLLLEPAAGAGPVGFFERYTLNETAVEPAARELRAALEPGQPLDDLWLEEKLRGLLARMLGVQRDLAGTIARLPPVRAATRQELWRRLNRARDYIHSRCDTPLSLGEAARVAAMSPFHFLRAFKAAFGETPHGWLTACRVERAKFLLAHTELPVTEVCFALGYEALGSFSTRFRQLTGHSPRAWRQARGTRGQIRKFQEVIPSAIGLS